MSPPLPMMMMAESCQNRRQGKNTNEEMQDLMEVELEPLDRVPEGVASAFVSRFEHQEAIGSIASAAQAVGDPNEGGEIIVELGGGLVTVYNLSLML